MLLLRLLVDIVLVYCVLSYFGCAYVLISGNPYKDLEATTFEKVLASIIFLSLAPIMVADVILQKLRGGS